MLVRKIFPKHVSLSQQYSPTKTRKPSPGSEGGISAEVFRARNRLISAKKNQTRKILNCQNKLRKLEDDGLASKLTHANTLHKSCLKVDPEHTKNY